MEHHQRIHCPYCSDTDLQKNGKSPKQRENEYFKTKIKMLIEMIKTAVLQGIRFDYLFTDSWFHICPNAKQIFIIRQRTVRKYPKPIPTVSR